MQRQAVSSSTILSVGYDDVSAVLEVEFRRGRVYQYLGVPESVYGRLMSAYSKGGYHADYIKGRYRYRRIA